ncbi:hypothetical protein EMIT048CA2_140154 [Pseudomonas chlororaphis]|uniref:hypothetical protein n=1 Tax=Pseudomonas chlororaphis TaxID=587753 RepID=UPI0039E03141
MSNNEMVSVLRELLVDMAHNQGKRVSAYMPDIAALLAAPMPPAGGDPEVLGWIVTDINDESYFSFYQQTSCDTPLVDRAHVTRLQAEVQEANKRSEWNASRANQHATENRALQSELDELKDQGQGEPSHWADSAGNTITAELKAYNTAIGGVPASASSHYAEPLYRHPPAPQGEPVAVQKYDDTLLPFLALMRKELHANVGKGDRPGWLAMSSDTCLLEIFYHLGKLQKAVKNSDAAGMTEYAADVANMCMMLLDICGALAFVEPPAPVALMLPERMEIPDVHCPERINAQGWNACLDEVRRLNP